ncbi:MAG: cold shock domain-containing protein [Rhodobacteraceae bacterium]|nr:cold shock domain-containing protein [Paracoccaceae bacterium]
MTQEQQSQHEVVGRVKWFDPAKGFGFIVSDESGGDILLHANVLRNFGQSSVADHARITVLVQQTLRGAQAVEVLEILPPETEDAIPIEDLGDSDAAEIAALPLEPARVKWFDKTKGFGFANVYGRPEDVFIHIEVLRRSGFADLQPGEAVCLRVIEGKRGRMAAQVASWEAAVREKK